MTAVVSPDDLAAWARALGFSVEALALNRKGLVAPEQLNGFGSEIFRSVSLSIVFIGAAVTLACFVKPWWRWLAVVIQLCFAAFFVVQGVHAYLDRKRPEVVSAEGRAVFSGNELSVDPLAGEP